VRSSCASAPQSAGTSRRAVLGSPGDLVAGMVAAGTPTRHWPSSEPSARSLPVSSASTPPRSATSIGRSVGW